MLTRDEALKVLEDGEEIISAEEVSRAVRRIATEIEAALSDKQPLLLSIMGGAVVFTGQLLPLLNFPLDFDTIHVTRYGSETRGGELVWKLAPRENVSGRVVLLLDDILDEGHTLAETREMVMKLGAKEVYCAVFTDKNIGRSKPIKADFVGLTLPNRFVFGYGMDVDGAWRNLPAIYAMKDDSTS
ncbi:MAG TPA: hypoxanthine-guanine phosphoribosyltransferase [Burkholderiales bacterium]|jgi:hypoxanthine phosphoribosyltransferase|nr:hypoxanthine-guanine phosphoribosyltransferase [Burkholderiales bacterium]